MQQLPDNKKNDSKEEIFCLDWTYYNGRIKVCVILMIDTDKLNIVVYRYRINSRLKENEVDLKLTKNQTVFTN